MPTYILLANLTDEAIKAIKIAPKRINNAIKNFEEMGGKLGDSRRKIERNHRWP